MVGVGIFGEIHAQTYSEYDRTKLVAVCDLNRERAKKIAHKFNCDYTTKARDISQNEEIEVVSIVTPDFVHKEVCLQMLRSGKNVLVEKPLATSVKDAQEIIEAAKKAKVKLMVDFQNRWNPAFVKAKEKIEEGGIAKPLMAYARLSNKITVPTKWFPWSGRSGPQWFLFPHLVDLACWLIGERVISVYAKGKKGVLKKRGIDAYDLIQALLSFEDAFATLETSWILPPSWPTLVEFNFSLHGEKGRIEVDLNHQGLSIAEEGNLENPFITGATSIYGKTSGFFPLPIMHFVDSVARGEEPPIGMEEGLLNVRIIEAIMRSIEEGRIIEDV